jgi:hypothetical protein
MSQKLADVGIVNTLIHTIYASTKIMNLDMKSHIDGACENSFVIAY